MSYVHTDMHGKVMDLPAGKVVCVGRNYAEHARELGNAIPDKPLLFIKPSTALAGLDQPIVFPAYGGGVHHELELAVLFGKAFSRIEAERVPDTISGYALALDLTLRELQAELKKKGHPWEIAKGFDGACPISPFVRPDALADPQGTRLRLSVNGAVQQDGNTVDMLMPINALVAYASTFFSFEPGDVMLTGTPAGVGRLEPGDELLMCLGEGFEFGARVAG